MEPVAGFALLLVVVVAIGTLMSARDRQNKARIAEEIKQVGGEPIAITFKFVGYDRDNQHYRVEFTDALGRKHETRCKANVWTGRIFWQKTPAELLSDLALQESRWQRPIEATNSSKEQIIDDLVAENTRLRERLRQTEPSDGQQKRAL
jgi:hypothetical protein